MCIEHWLALSVENLIAEDADDDFFSEKGCFTSTSCYPNETTMVMNSDADAMNAGYSCVQR